ncbi:hypothetical protein [Rhizobium paknamense]|uniref:Uncharacterized membrane protein YbhN (UPF0104 family) n=1 Tax=Rhizobium paknamense TaxID=1206817 RepID=A0ABU0ID98_9HYPH|nr:hypothetical protein [Rhizobium paknamense]MDQ0456225.1 uncharacterized membrane protein YbhN (UPF0104 family) [Rhizobium paknamense]
MTGRDKQAALAAGLILVLFGLGVFLMPKLVLWIGDYSPALAAAAGALVLLSFFIVLWLRARYQRRHPEK